MSYSFENPCLDCANKDKCTDRAFVAGAIDGTHQTDSSHSHLGYGTITLECGGVETADTPNRN